MSRFAAIDVGSNALRLRIVEADPPSAPATPGAAAPRRPWTDLRINRAAVRLGGDVFRTGKLEPATITLAASALRDFREDMERAGTEIYRAVATSAVREAVNGATLVERARREAGIDLEVIEGVEEARLIRLAVLRKLDLQDALLVDVGGGSTELTFLEGGEAIFAASLPLGTVRLLEAYLRGDDGGRLAEEAIDRALAPHKHRLAKGPRLVIATGGNVDSLAAMLSAPSAGPDPGARRSVEVAAGGALLEILEKLSPAERAQRYALRADRADTIVPAAMIYLRVAALVGAKSIVAPGVGLREGILEDLADRHFHLIDEVREARSVLQACARVGCRYKFDQAHGELVSHLAGSLFDDLAPLHRLAPRDRLLLQSAAVLHDVGDFVRYDGHHKHSYYLILHSDVMGLSASEREVVANVARYHRKSVPDVAHPNFRDLDKDGRAKVRSLAAILRIADALDREHLGKVSGVSAQIDRGKGRVVLTLQGERERELEEWTVEAKSGLFRDVFGFDLSFRTASSSA